MRIKVRTGYKKFEDLVRKWPIKPELKYDEYIENIISITLRQLEYVKSKNAFDENYYISNYPEVLDLEVSPIEHYFFEGFLCLNNNPKNPSKTFDTASYYEKIKDFTNIWINPLYHYIFLENSAEFEYDGIELFSEYERFAYSEKVGIFNINTNYSRLNQSNLKVLIHIHGYYVDLVEDIIKRLTDLNDKFDFVVTTNSDKKKQELINLFHKYNFNVEIIQVENKGRDVAPLYVELKDKVRNYDLLLHLHTKKSPHFTGENVWYEDLLDKLASNSDYVMNVVKLFENNKKLGVAIPTIYEQLKRITAWNTNYFKAREIICKSKYRVEELEKFRLKFPVGNMFWARVDAIMPLFEMDFNYSDFPDEPLPNDGTIAHTLERLICFVSEQEGYYTCAIKPSKV